MPSRTRVLQPRLERLKKIPTSRFTFLSTNRRSLGNKGLAAIEIIPVIIVIALIANFSLGFFGIIQTGILTQIAARNYTYETFRHRTNLLYFHDVRDGNGALSFEKFGFRLHGIASDKREGSDRAPVATIRRLSFGKEIEAAGTAGERNAVGSLESGIFTIKEKVRNENIAVSPVWIRPVYGICLNSKCEPAQ